MKTEKERKRLSIFKVETKDVFITDDGKKFYDKEEAENWEWYLNNKKRIVDEYKFSDVSPMTLGLHYIVDPLFSYKFEVENYSKEKEKDIINYIYEHIKDNGLDLNREYVNSIVESHIKNKNDGWYVVIFDRHLGNNKLHFLYMTDLVKSKVINEV